MSPIFSILSFASVATAALTTSYNLPNRLGNPDEKLLGFVGSVVGAEGDRVTLALQLDDETASRIQEDREEVGVQTMTLAPTYFEHQTIATDPEGKTSGEETYNLQCQIPPATTAQPECTFSLGGELAHAVVCADSSQQISQRFVGTTERTRTVNGETTVETVFLSTRFGEDVVPDWCTKGSTIPESVAIQSVSMDRSEFAMHQVVITAGEEKLKATTGAGVTPTSAQSTGSQPTGSQTTSGSAGSASQPAQGTGAAGPMKTVAPALAGLGAAVAAFML